MRCGLLQYEGAAAAPSRLYTYRDVKKQFKHKLNEDEWRGMLVHTYTHTHTVRKVLEYVVERMVEPDLN